MAGLVALYLPHIAFYFHCPLGVCFYLFMWLFRAIMSSAMVLRHPQGTSFIPR